MIGMYENIMDKATGLWVDMKETGLEYERRVRKEWSNRVNLYKYN